LWHGGKINVAEEFFCASWIWGVLAIRGKKESKTEYKQKKDIK
jgi:hypothetical protein